MVSSAWTGQPKILRSRGGEQPPVDTLLMQRRMPPGTPALTVSEVLVPSHDGAQVPLAILHRADLKRDEPHPTLLVGYGAYGFSFEAFFDSRSVAWLERGGVIAYANVRGSGAFGDTWYRAGFKATKSNTWKDGVACAKYLVDQGYATPRTLGIWGTSAGGIFVGRSVTSAPDLFAAAVFDVGMMDTIRSEESANGITNISEFGTVKDPQEFKALLEMSTYHQIKDGVGYPAVLLIHGLNDPRVDVWQSGKAAARLQAASSSGKPVLLRLDGQAGHGVGSTLQQQVSKLADVYAFLLWQFNQPAVTATAAASAPAKP
jgi:prolyl oligopeptidase